MINLNLKKKKRKITNSLNYNDDTEQNIEKDEERKVEMPI